MRYISISRYLNDAERKSRMKCRETADKKRRKSNPGNGLSRTLDRNHSLFPDS